MIQFENTEVFNFEGAFRGMRNPMNSWDKSDSHIHTCDCSECPHFLTDCTDDHKFTGGSCFYLGDNDLALAQRLIKAGSDHRKFLRQIFVSVDITAPLYWWKEFDTYKVATVANSCSTMHKIHEKEFTLDDFSHEHLTDKWTDETELVAYNSEYSNAPRDVLEFIIEALNVYRTRYIQTGDKKYWWDMIQILPTSYNQRRTVTLNYETLRNIYGSRNNHKLPEWRVEFMSWIHELPYAEELITYC